MEKRTYLWARTLCHYAGESEEFLADFWERLQLSQGVYDEFQYFLDHESFLGAYNIDGCTVIDIMIWQMDRFKVEMDMGKTDMRCNHHKMLLLAFDTMLKMEKNPTKYLNQMRQDTGSDYPDKF
ncbi:MAG: hypothetical protein K2M46_04680 [Lachnospiraceae bacterium]|nr:hypothetical protein [Lachnospiraceae bacterium]